MFLCLGSRITDRIFYQDLGSRIADRIFYQVSDRSVRTERTQAESSGKLHERAKVLFVIVVDL